MQKLCYILSSALFLAGCGTVFTGTTQDIALDSSVKSVSVYIDGMFVCQTPCSYPADRSSGSLSIVGKKDGYEDMGISLRPKFNLIALGNLIFPYSWTTDFLTGGAWKYRRDAVYFDMKKLNSKSADNMSKIRRFALYNYDKLKIEAAGNEGDYIKSLAELTQKDEKSLKTLINAVYGEVNLAHILTNIK